MRMILLIIVLCCGCRDRDHIQYATTPLAPAVKAACENNCKCSCDVCGWNDKGECICTCPSCEYNREKGRYQPKPCPCHIVQEECFCSGRCNCRPLDIPPPPLGSNPDPAWWARRCMHVKSKEDKETARPGRVPIMVPQ